MKSTAGKEERGSAGRGREESLIESFLIEVKEIYSAERTVFGARTPRGDSSPTDARDGRVLDAKSERGREGERRVSPGGSNQV